MSSSRRLSSRERTKEESIIFEDLGVTSKDEDEVHLAVFLAIWLCVFALPSRCGSFIHPETFKVVSLMAHGLRFCLTIPVLASIYNGLNFVIACRYGPSQSQVYLLWHYVYVWIVEYFQHHNSQTSVDNGPEMCKYVGRYSGKYFLAIDIRHVFQQNKSV